MDGKALTGYMTQDRNKRQAQVNTTNELSGFIQMQGIFLDA
jgi:hypothetical protein